MKWLSVSVPALFVALCVVALTGLAEEPVVAEQVRARPAGLMPAERWLVTHPSHLRWWILPNLEKNQDRKPLITGILCICVGGRSEQEDGPQHLPEIRRRCAQLGLTLGCGGRHAHKSLDRIGDPFNPDWQEQAVEGLRQLKCSNLVLDMEPYYTKNQRYHRKTDAPALFAATRVWRNLGNDTSLFVYPAGPEYWHGIAVSRQAQMGGARVFGLDATTYNPYKLENPGKHMYLRSQYYEAHEIEYVPGFYLHVLLDPEIMGEAAKYGRCWFFPNTSQDNLDDLPHFGTANWKPRSLKGQMAAPNQRTKDK